MSYKNANAMLPHDLLRAIQEYIDGEYIYIPRRKDGKRPWGANTETRKTLHARNGEILAGYRAGCSVAELAERYFLSTKAIYKIINAARNG